MGSVRKGMLEMFLAYCMWGILPIYWKALEHVDSVEILCHRVIWSMVATCLAVTTLKKWESISDFIRDDFKGFVSLVISGFIITLNWGLYIWAVNHGKVLETSLGYFINPLITMLFGMMFFHEKLRRVQLAALLLVVMSVLIEFVTMGMIPLVSLGLAVTFGFYGVVKKGVHIDSISGLFIETLAVSPFALYWLYRLQSRGAASFPYDTFTTLLLITTGIITTIPLILFAMSFKHITLTTAGFIQYTSPMITFFLGTFVYKETLPPSRLISFCFIWAAIAIYVADSIRHTQE
ncbi:MAG: EamA family transporter RarD [Synergistaceae bacterium]|nr:EamA family transporter RarD [Synergistaceae bacterium]